MSNEFTLDSRVTPRPIFPRHLQDKFSNVHFGTRAARFALLARIVFLGNQTTVPGQKRIGSHKSGSARESLPANEPKPAPQPLMLLVCKRWASSIMGANILRGLNNGISCAYEANGFDTNHQPSKATDGTQAFFCSPQFLEPDLKTVAYSSRGKLAWRRVQQRWRLLPASECGPLRAHVRTAPLKSKAIRSYLGAQFTAHHLGSALVARADRS